VPKSKKQTYAIATFLALVSAETLWGVNTSFIKLGLRTVPLLFFLSVTILGAAVLLLPFALKAWKPLSKKDYALLTIASLTGITLGNVALLMGLKYVFAFTSSVISLFKPLVLMLLSVQFLKEKFSLKTFYGIIIAFIGAAIIIWQPWQANSSQETTGVLLIILAALCDVIATIMIKPIVSRSNSCQITALHLLIGIAPIAVYSFINISSASLSHIGRTGLLAIILNILAITLANVLFYFGLKYRQVQKTGIFQYVNPVATLIAAWLILNEVPSWQLATGSVFIAAGLYIAEFSRRKGLLLKR
jgi:drug/metabolite transporter (DMT)-like permease